MWRDSDFPGLRASPFRITSPTTPEYNCIAWAAGSNDAWWWPDPMGISFWPDGIAREVSTAAFIAAYGTVGFTICDGPNLEEGFEKVALYVLNGQPTHAARQLPSGMWTSKLGRQEDIEHTLRGIEGPAYGIVAVILKRPIE